MIAESMAMELVEMKRSRERVGQQDSVKKNTRQTTVTCRRVLLLPFLQTFLSSMYESRLPSPSAFSSTSNLPSVLAQKLFIWYSEPTYAQLCSIHPLTLGTGLQGPSSLPSGLCTGGIGEEGRRAGICTSKHIGMEGMGSIFEGTKTRDDCGKSVLASMGYMKVDEVVWMKTTHLQKVYRTERMGHWLNYTKEHTDDSSFQSQITPSHTFPHGSTEALTEDLICTRNLSHARVLETSQNVQWICLGDRKLEIFGGKPLGGSITSDWCG
ncbi:hypothetical protein C8R42DRAFT_648956 [Lentinula raphanica]|nr:hypothetical protein C8R42DRAFT_648956 [Lentinula raphanica]